MTNQLAKFVAKDFIILRGTMKTSIAVGVLMALFFYVSYASQPALIISIVAFPVIYGFVNKALYEDEKNNTLRYLAALPLKREIIVYARYVSVALITIIVTLILLVIDFAIRATGMLKTAEEANGMIIIPIIGVFIIILSIYLPIAFKLGYIKAAGINRFIFIGIFAACGVIGLAADKLFKGTPPAFVSRLDNFFSALNPAAAGLIFLAFVIAVYMASMNLSVKFFRKRDLFK